MRRVQSRDSGEPRPAGDRGAQAGDGPGAAGVAATASFVPASRGRAQPRRKGCHEGTAGEDDFSQRVFWGSEAACKPSQALIWREPWTPPCRMLMVAG